MAQYYSDMEGNNFLHLIIFFILIAPLKKPLKPILSTYFGESIAQSAR